MWRFLACVPLVAGCATGVGSATSEPPTYLALGDSVAFGYSPLTDHKTDSGYAELIAANQQLDLSNAACPGEESGGFMASDGEDRGCRENRQKYALHVAYTGTQLAYAVDFLKKHPTTELVTIDLGGNDVGKLNDTCMGATGCILGGVVGTLTAYETHMHFILGELRKVYDGPLVTLGIYNPYPGDSTAEWGIGKLNTVLAAQAQSHGAIFVDGAAAFSAVSKDPCADGMLIKMDDGHCDIHPTPKGHEILAGAIETAMSSAPSN